MLSKDQNQEVGEGGIAVQANGNVTIGLSYSDAKGIALDVFQANFYKLSAEAMKLAEARATEITDIFLEKLQRENPEGFSKGQDPDFQHSLFTTQKEYARSGDQELGELLVDLLVDRSKQNDRNILQIVLNESLSVAPKLTSNHLACLAILFLFRYTQNYSVGNHDLLGAYLDKHVQPFVEKLVPNDSCYQHLQFTGCGSVQAGQQMLEETLVLTYQGLFLRGFDVEEIEKRNITIGLNNNIFMPCLNDMSKLQVRANSVELLNDRLKQFSVSEEDTQKIIALFNENVMSHDDVRKKCIEIRPYMETVFNTWSSSSMKSFSLTSVGMAIGHANIKKLIGEFASLSIWVN